MEANEAQELQEHAEHGSHESALRPVAFTMSVLAVLVAVTTVLGHRTHTEAVLNQNKATDQWNVYQAKKIRSNNTALAADLLSVVTVSGQNCSGQNRQGVCRSPGKVGRDLKEEQEKAEALETKVEQAEARANRFDLARGAAGDWAGDHSVTLLTRSRIYWYFGIVFSVAGIASALRCCFLSKLPASASRALACNADHGRLAAK